MSKLFLFLLLLAAIYLVRRSLVRGSGGDASSAATAHVPRQAETMRECAHCGLVVPQSEGVRVADAFYCSAAHASQGPRQAS